MQRETPEFFRHCLDAMTVEGLPARGTVARGEHPINAALREQIKTTVALAHNNVSQ